MKRVCLVRQKSYPAQRNLRRSAETLVKEGYEVDVVCVGFKGQRKRETMNGVNIYRIYFSYHRDNIFWYLFDYFAFFTLSFLKLTWLTIKHRYDVIEVHTMPDFLVFVALFPKLLGSKVILYMFENTTQLFISGFRVSRRHLIARFLTFIAKVSALFPDRVIVSDGPLHKKEVESYNIPGDKITVVLNVPDESAFSLQRDCITENGNHFRLVIVSSVLKRYGIQTLIKAVPLLLTDIPQLKVDIVGNGEYSSHIEQKILELGIQEYVNLAGFVPYEKVPAFISRADICVAPMIHDVGAPNKIFEYSALSKPIVASDLPGLRSVFDDSSVLYFEPGNEKELAVRILELYHNAEKRGSLANSAHAVYCRYDWSVMKQLYLRVYKELLG
jgi:glycosyltransferase involved in cell wall biosynthesis